MRLEQLELEFSGNHQWYKIGILNSQLAAVLIPPELGSPRAMRCTPALSPARQRILDRLCFANQAPNATVELGDLASQLGLRSGAIEDPAVLRERLVVQERDLVTKLENLLVPKLTREQLLGRKRDIQHRLDQLAALNLQTATAVHYDSRYSDRLPAIDADLRGAQDEIEHCDRKLAEVKAQMKVSELDRMQIEVGPSYRQQLQKLEDRLDRWRQTLRDIKSHRESIESSSVDALLDRQVAEQMSSSTSGDARAPMRSLESQLYHARQQVDYLVSQYSGGQHASQEYPGIAPLVNPLKPHGQPAASGFRPEGNAAGYYVQQDEVGRTQIAYQVPAQTAYSPGSLAELLQSMQRDLHDVCNQLSHQEACHAATALQQQVQQLKRCETELLQSVQRLMEERAVLLRKIADHHHLTSDQVSLAFGDWCQCNDHTQLREWLLDDEKNHATAALSQEVPRTQLLERLARLESQRKKAQLRAEECRRQLREADRSRAPRTTVPASAFHTAEELELVRERDELTATLREMELRDSLTTELDEVRTQLQRLPARSGRGDEFQLSVNKHIVGLSGSLYRMPYDSGSPATSSAAEPYSADWIHGASGWCPQSGSTHYSVPNGVVVAAENLAIAQKLAVNGETVPVLLYQSLDSMAPKAIDAAVAYLSWYSNQQPVIVLTRDSRVAQAVERQGGQTHRLPAPSRYREDLDVNQQLSAYANEEEAAKWYKPNTSSPDRTLVRQYYLNEFSAIEECTTIPSKWLQRLQHLGIDRVGDLLDVDPMWLSSRLKSEKVTSRTVRSWQATAELLCSVRGLRPFDARVLVGAGVGSVNQLSTLHPAELLERVDSFLSTDKGRRILQSGNRYELTRITSWIAAAGSGTARMRTDYPVRKGRRRRRYPGLVAGRARQLQSRGEVRATRQLGRHATGSKPKRSDQHSSGDSLVATNKSTKISAASANGQPSDSSLRFYLDLTSPVIDAPSIGSRMSERLRDNGVHTVEQLIQANPESLARRIAHRRVNADTVRDWQLQARLVCQIPYLRGHDAQLLVACDITTPQDLAQLPAAQVLQQVLGFAQTPEGQRMLRGNKQPDLEEVEHWIRWASQFRSLKAA